MKKVCSKIIIWLLVLSFFIEATPVWALTKEENIYTKLNSDGTINSTFVYEHLYGTSDKMLKDKSSLSNIENINGKEKYSLEDNELTWEANGNDIYYTGTTNKDLPISMSIKYYLDDEEYQKALQKWNDTLDNYENQLDSMSENIDLIKSEIEKAGNTDIATSLSSGFNINMPGCIYFKSNNEYDTIDDFWNYLLNTDVLVGLGVDQGIFKVLSMLSEEESDGGYIDILKQEFDRLIGDFEARGMNSQDVVKFFNMIDSQGACTYAQTVLNIIHKYKDNPDYFEEKFGFPLYVQTGNESRINSAELLADLYLYMNDKNRETETGKVGSLWDTSDSFTFTGESAENQVYLSPDENTEILMKEYLKSHGIDAEYNMDVFYNRTEQIYTQYSDKVMLGTRICEVIDNPDTSLSINYGNGADNPGTNNSGQAIPIYRMDPSTQNVDYSNPIIIDGNHALNAVSYSNDGVIVNTWGELYTMKWDDIFDGGGRMILSETSIVER